MGSNGRKGIHFAWWTLVGLCIVVGLSKTAFNNAAGMFLPPITKDLGIKTGELTLYFSISSIVAFIFLPIGGKLLKKFNTKYLLIIAVILQAGAFSMFGFGQSVWTWYVFAAPLAVGGIFTTVIAGPVLINQWFKKRNGLALGIVEAATGLLGVAIQPIIGLLIGGSGWRNTYFIVGISCLIILIPTVIVLLGKTPKQKGVTPYGQKTVKRGKEMIHDESDGGITFKDARKSAAFFMLIIFFFFITSFSSFLIHIPSYLADVGFDIAFVGDIMGVTMLGLFVGSLLFGYLCDRIGTKITSLFAMGIGILSTCLLLFVTGSTWVIVIALFMFGLVTASIGTLAPSLATVLFGRRDYEEIYSNSSLGLAISTVIALPAYGYIFEATGSYRTVLYIMMVILAINIVCIMIAFWSKERMIKKGLWHDE